MLRRGLIFRHCIANATVIGYGPFLPQSPTHPNVVEESLQYPDISSKLGQEFTIIICDLAICEIDLGLQKKTVKYDKVILRMGCFHIA